MIKQNKKGWVAKDFIVAMLIFSGCIALYVIMIGSIANDYSNEDIINSEFSASFDKFSEDTERAEEMYGALTEAGGLSLVGTTELLFFSTFKVVSLVAESIKTAASIMITFPTFFGFDRTASILFMSLIYSILAVYVTFIIINSIRGANKL